MCWGFWGQREGWMGPGGQVMMHHVGVVQDVECNQDLLGEQNGMPCTTGPEKKRNLWHEGGGYPIPC